MSFEMTELIGLIFTIVVQFAVMVWWAASLSNRLSMAEKWIDANDRIAERLAAMETKIDNFVTVCGEIRETFRLIFDRLDRKADKP